MRVDGGLQKFSALPVVGEVAGVAGRDCGEAHVGGVSGLLISLAPELCDTLSSSVYKVYSGSGNALEWQKLGLFGEDNVRMVMSAQQIKFDLVFSEDYFKNDSYFLKGRSNLHKSFVFNVKRFPFEFQEVLDNFGAIFDKMWKVVKQGN